MSNDKKIEKCPTCRMELIDKEIFYGSCLNCGESLPEEEDPNQVKMEFDGKD